MTRAFSLRAETLSGPPALDGLPYPALQQALEEAGVPVLHASRIFRALHREDRPLDEIADLGYRNVARLEEATRRTVLRIEDTSRSEDGTSKLLLSLEDGAVVEAVLIPMRNDRVTLCVSTQVGCAMGCRFCATGTLGLKRHLSAAEIVAQVRLARKHLANEAGGKLHNLVFMGMGEPLHHYGATRDALQVLLDGHGLAMKARNVTVSTVGRVPELRRFSEDFEGRVQLALSLHAGTDETRRSLIPLAARYDMDSLKKALLEHPLPGSRAIMIEYVVLPGVNDGAAEMAGLARFTEGLRCLVNIIPFNPFPNSPYRAPTEAEVHAVVKALHHHRVPHSVRWPRGRNVAGACGQLAGTRTT